MLQVQCKMLNALWAPQSLVVQSSAGIGSSLSYAVTVGGQVPPNFVFLFITLKPRVE